MFQDAIAIGLVFSVLFQETFRLLIYLLLDKADAYLKKLTETEETQIFANKHILAYVVGLVRLISLLLRIFIVTIRVLD